MVGHGGEITGYGEDDGKKRSSESVAGEKESLLSVYVEEEKDDANESQDHLGVDACGQESEPDRKEIETHDHAQKERNNDSAFHAKTI